MMSNLIKVVELRKVILSALKTVHPRVYHQSAPDNAVYPYFVYNLPNSVDDGSLEQFVLDIDCWDISLDTTALETLINSADKVLHRKTIVVDDNLSMTFYRNNRLTLTDEDPRIRRRKYIYEVRTFERR
jgi:hypothetical protein